MHFTDSQLTLIEIALRIAEAQFTDDARVMRETLDAVSAAEYSGQFLAQAAEAGELAERIETRTLAPYEGY